MFRISLLVMLIAQQSQLSRIVPVIVPFDLLLMARYLPLSAYPDAWLLMLVTYFMGS